MPASSKRPARWSEVELLVEGLAFGGAGIARIDGYVVFVKGAFPGDRVRAKITKAKRSHAEALTTELLEAGPDRIPPRAQHPGAPWQELRYERQLEEKHRQLDDALRRIGQLDGFDLDAPIPALQSWRYRNKLEYSFGEDGSGELVCGFHAPGRWDLIEPLEDCILASERGNQLRDRVLAWCREEGLSAYDRREGVGFLRNLVVREGRRTGQFQLRLVTSPGDFRAAELAATLDCDGLLWTQAGGSGETTAGGLTELVAGSGKLEEELCGLRFKISPEAFFQTNTEMAESLYGVAMELAQLDGSQKLFDLYCGTGTVALVMAGKADRVFGIELVDSAVVDAAANAAINRIDNAEFLAGDVRLVLPELLDRVGQPDTVVVDPPRAGLAKRAVRRLLEAGPKRIVYISCNPTTLAPNAAQMVEAGYTLTQVQPVDMFPQTPHIECVAVLDKKL